MLSRVFERYAQPLAFIDSFLALVMLGVLLAIVRWAYGAIAACIGLHQLAVRDRRHAQNECHRTGR